MNTIQIQERTPIEDVLTWNWDNCNVLRLGRRSSFEPGAQGLAISSLAALDLNNKNFIIECDFVEPSSPEELELSPIGSAFGFALARLTSQIHFEGTAASNHFKVLLANLYKSKLGIFGSGNNVALVCPDPIFPFPPALHTDNNQGPDYFPAPSDFLNLLNKVIESMGFRTLLGSSQESPIASFVYEAFRNSLEHGISSNANRARRSTRVLLIEKIVLDKNVENRFLSNELKEYLERIREGNRGKVSLGIVCLTVSDQGNGIQETLPPIPEETPEQRLIRAFLPEQSRKPAGVVKRGLGLPKVIFAAHQLQAMLRISSGNLAAMQDFSNGDEKYPQLNLEAIRKDRLTQKSGTSISIFLPEFSDNSDQQALFTR